VLRLEDYLRRVDEEIGRMSYEIKKVPTYDFSRMKMEFPPSWNRRFEEALASVPPATSLDLAPSSPLSESTRYWPLKDRDLIAIPKDDVYAEYIGEVVKHFSLPPVWRDWLKREGPKHGARGIWELAKQMGDLLQKQTQSHPKDQGGSQSSARDGRAETGAALEFTVRGQKIRVPDFMIEFGTKVDFGEWERRLERLYRGHRKSK